LQLSHYLEPAIISVTNIFIRNLDSQTTEPQLRKLFAASGSVKSVTIVKDRDTGEPRGLAFVEMGDVTQAQAAIASLNGFRLNDRALSLNEARAKDDLDESRASSSREHRRHRF
jgi:cold-inducible RNA-binding protein